MMQVSAGIIVFKDHKVFLVHPAGPFDKGRNRWTVPKGLTAEGETFWETAVREWEEETGDQIRTDSARDLGQVKSGNKINHMFAVNQDAEWKSSNTFTFTFRNGTTATYYETDAGDWFRLDEAEQVLPRNLKSFIPRLREILNQDGS